MNSHSKLTPEEYSLLEPVLEKISQDAKQRITLDQLIGIWTKFIGSVESGYADSIYEYTNDLSTRDLLQTVLNACSKETYIKLFAELEPLDNRFKFASREIDRPLLPDQNWWWWYRIPIKLTDDLKDDLDSEGFLAQDKTHDTNEN